MCFLHFLIKAEHQRNYSMALPECMYCINNHCCRLFRSTFGLQHCLLILHFQSTLYCRPKYDLEKLFQWYKAWMHSQDVTYAIAMSPAESCFRSVYDGCARIDKIPDIADSMCKIHSTYDAADVRHVRIFDWRMQSSYRVPSANLT